MARISDLLAAGPTVSFEFFPPKTDEAQRTLEATLAELRTLAPSFVSVTYGAGGSTRDRTRRIFVDINRDEAFPAMPHLTCAAHTEADLVALLDDYVDAGIENILALAGDPPLDGSGDAAAFRYAIELVELVRDRTDLCIGVAAFPELHPRSASRVDDRRHLADKLRRADFAISQFFYDPADYLAMVDELEALGVDAPVLPGIMAPTNPAGVRRMAAMNGTRTPDALLERIEAASPGDALAIAVDATTELCRALLDEGVPGLHFYTLNRAEATTRIHANLWG